MTNKKQLLRLASAIEELALECMQAQVQKDTYLYEYAPSVVDFHKKLILGNLHEQSDKNYFIYNYDTVLCENIKHDLFNTKDLKQIKFINESAKRTSDRVAHGYVYRPNHIVIENDLLKINWSKFDLKEHIKFLKESIVHESIAICDWRVMRGFWDGSDLLLSEGKKRKVLNEGMALGCDKKPYSYARRAFDKTKKDIYNALTREGFIVENVYDAGSLRRKKSIIGDLDFLVNVLGHQKIGLLEGNNPDQERIFTEQYQWLFGQALKKHIVTEVCKTRKNITQFISENMQCDVFLCTPTATPTRRCYWTGSAAHNVKILYEGFKKDILYSYDYIYDKNKGKLIMPKNEKEIFSIFGLDYIPPEKRF